MDRESVSPQEWYVCTCCGNVWILEPAAVVMYLISIRYLTLFERSQSHPVVRVSTDLRLGWDEPDPRSVTPRSPGYVHNVELTLHLSSSRPVLYPDLSRFWAEEQQEDDDSEMDLSLKL